MQKSKLKRKRGVVLTPVGLKRLQAAILAQEITENHGQHFTMEELSDRIKISPKTLSRLWSLNVSVDQKTLKLCFSAFNLKLTKEDYTIGDESDEISLTNLDSIDIDQFEETNLNTSLPENQENAACHCSFPDGPVPLDSPFYIERPPIEQLAYQEITQSGCVLRIRAPREMGKTSLVMRVLAFAEQLNYQSVILDCHQIDADSLSNLNKFLRCFCTRIAKDLGIDPNLDEIWDEEIGTKLSCSFYFKSYLLKQINNPIVLVLEQVDRFFEYPQIAQEFFPLLRSWYEEARRDTDWQKLRLVVVYSTEAYVTLDLNRSPFNVGVPLRLPEFTQKQVEDLAKRHGLNWDCGKESSQLMSLVGGHPSLIRIALYYLTCQKMSLTDIIQDALANGGIYRYHLWRHWVKLQENHCLAKTYAKVVTADHSISLDPIETHKLESLGMIAYEGDRVIPRCQLYRIHFKKQLSTTVEPNHNWL